MLRRVPALKLAPLYECLKRLVCELITLVLFPPVSDAGNL